MSRRRKTNTRKDALSKYEGGSGVRNWKLSIVIFCIIAGITEVLLIRATVRSDERVMMVLMTFVMTIVFLSFILALLRLGPSVKGEEEPEEGASCGKAKTDSKVERKTLRVAAAVLFGKDESILAAERGYGAYEGWFEFPGGKLEEGETAEEACRREIREELGAEIRIYKELAVTKKHYPEYDVELHAFLATLESDMELREHHSARRLSESELDSVRWLPSDLAVVNLLKEQGLHHFAELIREQEARTGR